MDTIITTRKVGAGIAEVEEDFILAEEPMSRLVFHAQIHAGGIRGRIIRQRRESKDDIWIPDRALDIRALGKNESINIEFTTDSVKVLYLAIRKLANILKQRGIEYGENRYRVVDPDLVAITNQNKATYIKKIIEAGYDEEVWNSIAESNPSLVTKLSYARIHDARQKVVEELVSRLLSGSYSETTGPDSWQSWIYRHNWLFGINYRQPIEKTKINVAGVMPDFLFPTLDGFVDILEIKLPNDSVLVRDQDHPGTWRWTLNSNTAIGQVINYLCEIDRLRLEIERNIKAACRVELSLVRPRAFILIGNSSDWETDKLEGLRKMNHALHGITVLTYKDVLDRGKQAVSLEGAE